MKVNLAPGLINEGSNYTTRVAQRIDLDAAIAWTSGTTTDAALYSIQRDAAGPDHLQLNVPSGRGFKFSIAATEELIWTTGAFAFQQATTLSTSTGALSIDAASGSAIRLNDAQANVDIVIESDAADNLTHWDASTGTIGVNVGASTWALAKFGGTLTGTGLGDSGVVYIATTAPVIAGNVGGMLFTGGRLNQADTGTHAVLAGAYFTAPVIGDTGGDAVTTAATTVYIKGAPIGQAVTEYALLVDAGNSRFDGNVFINETANGNMIQGPGLTINQGAADDQILAFKSSDVTHGLTSGTRRKDVETDDFFTINKLAATGGVVMQALINQGVDNVGLSIEAYGATGNLTKGTGANACVEFYIADHDGSNSLADVDANGNVFGVRAQVGGSALMRFLIDEDGDLYSVTSAQTFDQYDDALMVRALDQVKGDVIRDRWDDYVTYNEQALIDAEVLGAPISEGGMTNITQLQRLHNGAIWQGYTRQMEMQERIDSLETKLLAIEGAR